MIIWLCDLYNVLIVSCVYVADVPQIRIKNIRTRVVLSTDLQDELAVVEDEQEGSGRVVLGERGRLEVELARVLVIRILKKEQRQSTPPPRTCGRRSLFLDNFGFQFDLQALF